MSNYLRCATCGQSFLADYQHEPDDGRRIMLGRCRRCHTEAAATIPTTDPRQD